mgnify:CR=1 FL=1
MVCNDCLMISEFAMFWVAVYQRYTALSKGEHNMKLFHCSDLHLGKRMFERSLLEDQRYLIDQICRLAALHRPDGILISGDVYDKTIPPVEAVHLLDDFLTQLHRMGICVYLIAGNHDSAGRLDFGRRCLEEQNVHICGMFNGTLAHVEKQDAYGTVHFYLLPFLKPALVLPYAGSAAISTYADAVRWALQTVTIDPAARNVLLAHQFVTWNGIAEQSDSEVKMLGGVDAIDASLLFGFDYVALGHLHSPQRIGKDTIRYAGSPMKYSFSELRQKKGLMMVELRGKGDISMEFLPLEPLHEMREIRGNFVDLLEAARECGGTEDYIRVILTDSGIVYDPVRRLQAYYPNLMTLERAERREMRIATVWKEMPQEEMGISLFSQFFEKQNGKSMDGHQRKIAETVWKEMEEESK